MTKRPFTGIFLSFFFRDWVGVQCTLVQDRKECIGWMPGH